MKMKKIKKELAELKAERDSRTQAAQKMRSRKAAMEEELEALDNALDRLALGVALGTESEDMFLMRFDARNGALAQIDLATRAEKGLAPLLNDQSLSNQIRDLQGKIDQAEKRAKYDKLLVKLNESYDKQTEKELVQAARYAGIPGNLLDDDALIYRRKHGIPVPEMFPLNLADQV